MQSNTVYTKTAKGILEIKNKTVRLPRDVGLVFLSIDGKATVADLAAKSGMPPPKLNQALEKLLADGYIKTVGSASSAATDVEELDLDFTSPEALAKLNVDAATRARAETDANARASEERRAALQAKLRQEAEARARALAEVRANAEAEAREQAEAAAQAATAERIAAENALEAAVDPASRADAESRVRAAAAAVARAEAEARVRAEAEERARALAESKKAAEEEARDEAEKRTRAQNDALAVAAAEAEARVALETQIRDIHNGNAPPPAFAARAPQASMPELIDPFEMQQQAARLREAAAAELREREWEPTFQLEGAQDDAPRAEDTAPDAQVVEPRAEELQARVKAERRAREETRAKAQGQQTALGSAPDAARTPGSQLPALDIDAGTARHAAPLRSPPAFGPDAAQPSAGLARAMKDAAARVNAPDEPDENAPRIEEDDEPGRERVNVERIAHDIIAEQAAARARDRAQVTEQARAAIRSRQKEEEARRVALFERLRRRRMIIRSSIVIVVLLLAAITAFLQFISLTPFIPGAQQAISARLNQPVTIGSLRYPLFPAPRLVLGQVTIGRTQGIQINELAVDHLPLVSNVYNAVQGRGVTIDPAMIGPIVSAAVTPGTGAPQVKRLQLTGIKVTPARIDVGPFDADVAFAENGTVRQATLKNEKAMLELTPLQSRLRLKLSAREWRAPIGPAVDFTYLDLGGTVDASQLVVNEIQGRLGGGAISGTMVAKWGPPIVVTGEFKTENVRLQDVMPAFTQSLALAGLLSSTGRYTLQSNELETLFSVPQVEATFDIARGELKAIDLVRTIQASSGTAFRGGRTPFDELSGTLRTGGGRYSYRQLALNSGPLNASGAIDVGPAGELSGSLAAEVGAKGRIVARTTVTLSGTLKDPVIRQ